MSPADHFTNTLFEESYWLDCVAENHWQAVTVERGGKTVGRLPFILKKRGPFQTISSELFTPWLGPWVSPGKRKGSMETGHQHGILTQLIGSLPQAHKMVFPCAPEMTNLLPFYWDNYKLELSYTYRLSMPDDEEQLWCNLKDKTRNTCRKAAQKTQVNTERHIQEIFSVLDKTFRRQGLAISASYGILERIYEAMSERQQCQLYCAEDARGRIHAFVFVVYDERHSFYICGGGDPALRESGAHALAMWHAIKGTIGRSKIFDFEGSMIPRIEQFVRGFAAEQTPRYSAWKYAKGFYLLEHLVRSTGLLRANR